MSKCRTGSTRRCSVPATRRLPRYGICERLAPTRSGCPRCPKRSPRATWGSRCSESPASRTWRPACCRSRSITRKSWRPRSASVGNSLRFWRASLPGSDALVARARHAREHAVADYSHFKVGAALETSDGTVITGCNIENATYGLTVCAERVAMFKALSDGHRTFTRIAIVARTAEPTPPCGACRQILWEFGGDIEVVLANLTDIKATHRLRDLLPLPFDARLL